MGIYQEGTVERSIGYITATVDNLSNQINKLETKLEELSDSTIKGNVCVATKNEINKQMNAIKKDLDNISTMLNNLENRIITLETQFKDMDKVDDNTSKPKSEIESKLSFKQLPKNFISFMFLILTHPIISRVILIILILLALYESVTGVPVFKAIGEFFIKLKNSIPHI